MVNEALNATCGAMKAGCHLRFARCSVSGTADSVSPRENPQPLLDAENASLLPHVGSATVHTRQAMADLVVDNLIAWFSRGETLSAVPETEHLAKRK